MIVMTDLRWMDPDPYVGSGTDPVFLVRRSEYRTSDDPPASRGREGGDFAIFHSTPFDDSPQITWDRSGDGIKIPILGYRVSYRAALLAWGFDVGDRVARLIRDQTGRAPYELIVVLGNKCHYLEDQDCYRAYMGLAARM